MFTSCYFHNLCLDTATQEFVLVQATKQKFDGDVNAPELALGSINPRWSGRGYTKGFHKIRWSPRILQAMPQGYYQLPDHVIMVPFHSMAAHNVGHLLWDDFYPLYTLFKLFGFADRNNYQHLLLRSTAQEQLYATCEMQKKKSRQCQENFQRFLPLLGVDPLTFSTVKNVKLEGVSIKSSFVCSKHSVAGIGMLSDHGLRDHGTSPRLPRMKQLLKCVQIKSSCFPLFPHSYHLENLQDGFFPAPTQYLTTLAVAASFKPFVITWFQTWASLPICQQQPKKRLPLQHIPPRVLNKALDLKTKLLLYTGPYCKKAAIHLPFKALP